MLLKQLNDLKYVYIHNQITFLKNVNETVYNTAAHYLTIKYTGIVQLVEFVGEVFLGLLEIAAIVGTRV